MIKFNFTTFTPLHISNGEQLGFGLDYIINSEITTDDKGEKYKETLLYKLNFLKLSELLSNNNEFDFLKNYNLNSIIEIIERNKDVISKNYFQYKVLITKPFSDHLRNPRAEGQRYVSEFINSNGNFYIPASSIKGAFCTILNVKNGLGINPNDARISDKVVFSDSEFIDQSNFNIFCSNNRPPKVNLMCLKKNIEFSLVMRKSGNIDLSALRKLLKEYSSFQIEKAKEQLQPFKTTREEPKGADIFESALLNLDSNSLEDNEYLINLGFGGGSWFKIEKGKIPIFKSKRKGKDNPDEPAHTSVSFNSNPMHIGWCKLKIEEL